jgi:hypothetical protein
MAHFRKAMRLLLNDGFLNTGILKFTMGKFRENSPCNILPSPPKKGANTTPMVGIELRQNPIDIAVIGTKRLDVKCFQVLEYRSLGLHICIIFTVPSTGSTILMINGEK